jgi:hypothetical protein
MASDLLQSSQTKETIAPDYYKSALSTIANCGKAAMSGKFIGAVPLQTQAFSNASTNAGAYKPTLAESGNVTGQAADVNIAGAANPYLSAAYGQDPSQLAASYMSPYIQNAVQGMSNVGMQNIQNNLSPQATAAAVGSGQFGSQRGAQVLGQVQANAMNDLNSQIANMQNSGYGNAMQAATARQALLNQLGSTAGNVSAACASAKNTAGANLANLGQIMSNTNIACAELLSKLGAECQTIKQNEQCYALSKMCKYATMLGKNQVPTTVKTTMCMSPLSTAGTIGSGILGFLCKAPGIIDSVCSAYNKIINFGNTGAQNAPPAPAKTNAPVNNKAAVAMSSKSNVNQMSGAKRAEGGLITPGYYNNGYGCASLSNYGALPQGR